MRIFKSSYQDNSYWIEYEVNGCLTYEIVEVDLFKDKYKIDNCGELLKQLITDCRESEGDMWYIDEDDETITEKMLLDLEQEVRGLNLHEYIHVNQHGFKIVVFGGVITKFLF